MARCSTCHRRLRAGHPCPTHGGAIAENTPVHAEPFVWPDDRDTVGSLLGAGGFAAVWALGDDRVIKLAHASHDLARARMAREAEALRAIGAPAVPRCHGAGVLADGRAWIVMDKVSGTTLSDVTAAGQMRSANAVEIGLAILEALEPVHRAQFVHRDIKPDNLVKLADGRIVVLDLGLARKLPRDPDDPTRANVQVGSLEYMPPEQLLDSASVDERSDLYAFGCVLFELLAGRPPFVGDAAALERAHTALRPPRLGALRSAPAAIESLVSDLLAKEPARRPASVAETRERLAVARDERTPARVQHSVSVIREGRQPVVLLWAELPRVDRALLGMLTARRLVVASQKGRRVLAGVLGGEHADPASIAIAAARDLAAAGARVALHLEALRVGSAGGASTLQGAPVEKPETWLPAGTWSGIVLTSALAAVTQVATRAADGLPDSFRALGDDVVGAIELVGREGLLTDLVTDAATALHGLPAASDTSAGGRRRRESTSGAVWRTSGPAFAVLVGDAGVGKSAFATELGKRLAQLGVRVHTGTVPPPGGGKPGASALSPLVDLGSIAGQGPLVRALGDALRSAARERPTAVILDDLHLAEHDLLDALEYATLGGEPIALWVLGIAAPRLESRRPHLGVRAERHRRDVLPPLDVDAAVALTASLLRPAEYPPLRALRRLAAIAQGNPLHLAMLAREIHQKGGVRQRPGGAHFLDTTAIDELSPAALGPWLAARELAGLAVELVALARVCAAVGGEVQRDELVKIVDLVERSGGATTTIDVDIGLAELVAAGILARTDHGFTFAQALVEEGVYATTNEEERLALHGAALAYWRDRGDTRDIFERVARHAEAIADGRLAARAYTRLGTFALAEQRAFDADQAWTGAVRHLPERDVERARALLGRARSRQRLQRMFDALADLREAHGIAAELGEAELELEILIDQATVLDHCEDFTASRETALLAQAKLRALPHAPSGFSIDVELAGARTLFRQQEFTQAAPLLRTTLAAARAARRDETATIAALLLGCALSDLRQLDEAEAVFAQLVELCIARDDRYHLGAAYGNRAWLWSARGELDRTAADLRLVIQLARESGQAQLERAATHNLAEHRLWEGNLEESLPLARRGLALQSSGGEGTTHPDRMLLARVLASLGEREELAEILATFAADQLGDDDRATLAVLEAVAQGDRDRLAAAMAGTDALFSQLRLELGVLAARGGALGESQRAQLRDLARADPVWAARIGEL